MPKETNFERWKRGLRPQYFVKHGECKMYCCICPARKEACDHDDADDCAKAWLDWCNAPAPTDDEGRGVRR